MRYFKSSRQKLIRSWLPILTLLLVSFIITGNLQAQYFTINDYSADITVHDDASITVKETIKVELERQRHGIYREIPFKYSDEFGHTTVTPLDVISVTDQNGNKRPSQVRKDGNVINIRIGDPDIYVSGIQVYVITYKVENVILFFKDHDELYWNVTGNYWKAPIENVTAKITLGTSKKSSKLFGACYTGFSGSKESACKLVTHEDYGVFTCERRLRNNEGFTVALGWDKGIIQAPSAWQKFWWRINLAENWVFVVPVFTLIFMFFRWYRRGRDPKVPEALVVQYEPPKPGGKPMTPAEVGVLIDENLDQRDITASIIGLAVKGYLKIEEIENKGLISIFKSVDYRLIKLKQPDENLTDFEKEIMDSLFIYENTETELSELKNKFYRNIPTLKRIIFNNLVDKKYFPVKPDTVSGWYSFYGFVMIAIGMFLSVTGIISAPTKGLISFIVSGFIIIAFARIMPVKTLLGARTVRDIKGFQEFMNKADKDRLEKLGTKEIFYKYLPYAVALDVVDNWARAFKDMYLTPPDWYVSTTGFATFNTVTFSRSITEASSSIGQATFSSPRGSGTGGGGGGGFSGGGSGGGGGGSW